MRPRPDPDGLVPVRWSFPDRNHACVYQQSLTVVLTIDSADRKLHYILAKPTDVPTYVEYGCADIGVVGKDASADIPVNPGTNIKHEDQPQAAGPDPSLVSMDDSLLIKLNEIIQNNLDNEQFSVEELAGEMAISRSHLHRKLQSVSGNRSLLFVSE